MEEADAARPPDRPSGGVDLGLVSWMGGDQLLESSGASNRRPSSEKVGRCLCAKEAGAVPPTNNPASVTVKKRTAIIDRPHIVPQVEVFSAGINTKPVAAISANNRSGDRTGSIQDTAMTTTSSSNATTTAAATANNHKPILSRKHWNNTIDVGSSSASVHATVLSSNLRRYGSQQSCKSASTLRSYLSTSNSRGKPSLPLQSTVDFQWPWKK